MDKLIVVPPASARTNWTVNEGHLRDRLRTVDEYAERFDEAAGLWAHLFDKDRVAGKLTEGEASELGRPWRALSRVRCQEVEQFLDWIIFGTRTGVGMATRSYIPTARESLILIAAAWLHPLGMIPDVLPDDSGETTDQDWNRAFENYHSRTAQYIRDVWDLGCGWSNEDKELLARLCESQRPGVDANTLPTSLPEELHTPEDGEIVDDTEESSRNQRNVNLRKLASLLRLANVLRLQAAFCPPDLAARLKPDDVNVPVEFYANVVRLTQGVNIDHGANTIALKVWIPEPVDLSATKARCGETMPLLLDSASVVEYVRATLQEILDEVSEYLMTCPNTRLHRVQLEAPSEEQSPIEMEDLLHEIWLLQLAATTCVTEAACCFAMVLCKAIDDEIAGAGSNVPLSRKLWTKLDVLEKVQPFNIVTRRLADAVADVLGNDPIVERTLSNQEMEELRETILEFIRERATNCKEAGELAAPALKDLDTIVLYGFSRNTFAAIEDSGFQGKFLCVPITPGVRRQEADHPRRPERKRKDTGEDARILSWFYDCWPEAEADRENERLKFVSDGELGTIIEPLITAEKQVAFVTGTRAILCDNDSPVSCFSSVGNRTIALAVRDAGGRVFVIGERSKICSSKERDDLQKEYKAAVASIPAYGRVDVLQAEKHTDKIIVPL